MSDPIDNTADVIDSRAVIERISDLRASWADSSGDDPGDYQLSSDDWRAGLSDDEADELVALEAFAREASARPAWIRPELVWPDDRERREPPNGSLGAYLPQTGDSPDTELSTEGHHR